MTALAPIAEPSRLLTRREVAKRYGVSLGSLDKMVKGKPIGHGPAALMSAKAVRQLRDQIGDRPAAARERVKVMRAMYAWAVEAGHVSHNPVQEVALPRQRPGGFRAWTMEHVEQWWKVYPVGSMARLCLDLLLFTMQRRGDIRTLGHQHVREIGGLRCLDFTQEKNRTTKPVRVQIPIMPPLAESIEATTPTGMTFLLTAHGHPFRSSNALGGRFAKWREAAKLPGDLGMHGMRKAGGALLGECGCTGLEIDAVLGHEDAGSGRVYVKSADRMRLAMSAMGKMESHLSGGSESHLSQVSEK